MFNGRLDNNILVNTDGLLDGVFDNVIRPKANIINTGNIVNLDATNIISHPRSGTTWFDLSTRGNNATLTNSPVFSYDGLGSVALNGSNQYINYSAFNLGNNFTATFWVKPTYNVANCQMLFFCKVGNSGQSSGVNMFFNTFNTDNRILVFSFGDGANYQEWWSPIRVELDKWQHFAISADKPKGIGKLFYNGKLVMLISNTLTGYTTSWGLRFGYGFSGFPLKGQYGRILVYNTDLNEEQIYINYNATKSFYGL